MATDPQPLYLEPMPEQCSRDLLRLGGIRPALLLAGVLLAACAGGAQESSGSQPQIPGHGHVAGSPPLVALKPQRDQPQQDEPQRAQPRPDQAGSAVTQTRTDGSNGWRQEHSGNRALPEPGLSKLDRQALQYEIEDLKALRKRLGSSVKDRLQGVLPNPDDLDSAFSESTFSRAITELAEKRHREAQLNQDQVRSQTRLRDAKANLKSANGQDNRRSLEVSQTNDLRSLINSKLPQSKPQPTRGNSAGQRLLQSLPGQSRQPNILQRRPAGPSRTGVRNDAQAKALRAAARELEEIAAKLEEVGLVQQADELRSRAGGFWREAR